MEMLKSIMFTITSMGATAILPLVIFLLGLVFRMKVGAAIKSGITVGIGFIGLGLVVGLLNTALQPAIAYYSKIGSGFTVADIGWPAVGAAAWVAPFAAMVIPIGIILNLILVRLKLTKTLNVDIWNRGSIIYISSGSALSGTGGGVSYPASKAGGEGLIRGLAKELGPKGVNVNAIAPRLIDTGEMMRVNYPTQADLDAVLEKIPVRRLGTIDDVANLAIFLADKDNSYIQGQTILMDGGRTIA